MRLDLYKGLIADNVSVGQNEVIFDNTSCPTDLLWTGCIPGIVIVRIALSGKNLDDRFLNILIGCECICETK